MKEKRVLCLLITLHIATLAFSQQEHYTLYFYGAISVVEDTNTLTLTQNLFFTQILSTKRFKVEDKRDQNYSDTVLKTHEGSQSFIFYMDINQISSSWNCILHLIDCNTGKKTSLSQKYAGYYKILMQAKNSITELLEKYENEKMDTPLRESSFALPKEDLTQTISSLAGTWIGEEFIDKIILLKAGRGFVIYKNGASMTISIKIYDDTIKIEQTAPKNASFFPYLPRQIALVAAKDADPIMWEFKLQENGKLVGQKHTLIPLYTDNKITSATKGIIECSWHR